MLPPNKDRHQRNAASTGQEIQYTPKRSFEPQYIVPVIDSRLPTTRKYNEQKLNRTIRRLSHTLTHKAVLSTAFER